MLKDLNYYYIFSKLRVGLVGQAFTFQRSKQKKLERMIEFQFPITKEYNHSVWWSNNPFREEKKVFWSALSLFCVWSKYKKQSWNNLPTPSNKHQLDIKHLEKSWDFFGQSVLKSDGGVSGKKLWKLIGQVNQFKTCNQSQQKAWEKE